MRLDFTVPAVSLRFLQIGQQIDAYSAAHGQHFSGTLSAIGSRIDPVSRSLSARATFPNEAGLLKPGLLMNVVLLGQPRMALVVPEEALVSSGNEHSVWRLEGSQARRAPVVIGERIPGWVEITQGLVAGDQVVRDGVARLRGTEATIRVVEG